MKRLFLLLALLIGTPAPAAMTAAQTALIQSRTIVTPAQWTPALGKQATDKATPAYYSVLESPLYMAFAGAPRSYALSQSGAYTRFELHQGDRNFADEATHTDCDRVELMARDDTLIPVDQAFNVSIDYIVEPGAKNTAKWFAIGQMHQDITVTGLPGSPPVAIEMVGDRVQVRVRWGVNGNDGQAGNFNKVVWTDSADIVRGKPFRLAISGMFDPVSGVLNVSKDGGAPAKYRGPLGYNTMAGAYLAHGIYRATVPEVMVVDEHIAYWWLSPLVF